MVEGKTFLLLALGFYVIPSPSWRRLQRQNSIVVVLNENKCSSAHARRQMPKFPRNRPQYFRRSLWDYKAVSIKQLLYKQDVGLLLVCRQYNSCLVQQLSVDLSFIGFLARDSI